MKNRGMTRRDFMKAGVLTAGAAALCAGLGPAANW